MNHWLKRLLLVLTIPFLALALTACPGPDESGADNGGPTIEEELEDAAESLEDAAGDVGQAVEEGVEEAAEAAEEAAEDVQQEIDDAEEDAED